MKKKQYNLSLMPCVNCNCCAAVFAMLDVEVVELICLAPSTSCDHLANTLRSFILKSA